jgi:RNA polymerase sigma factor (sigma-70 family)
MPTDPIVASLLDALTCADAQPAWTEFLSRYSGIVYHVIRSFDRDPDRSSDCFLYVCEQLSRDGFRRLRKFDVNGRATFSTWLSAVVRNLCLDWHRKEYGRPRAFKSIAGMEVADQVLFELVHRRGYSAEEARHELQQRGYKLTFGQVEEKLAELRRCMTSRHLWLLSSSNSVVESIEELGQQGGNAAEPADPSPDPEALATLRQTNALVSAALDRLGEADRLLVRLRYQEGLTLQQVASLVGLKDAQTADRRLREVIEQLRQALGIRPFVCGKTKAASV